MAMRWYSVSVLSNFEKKVAESIRDAAAQQGLADEIAGRYLLMCNTHGMSENHDALTGLGLHDPAFAWTSAVFLLSGGADRSDARPKAEGDETQAQRHRGL